MLKYAKIIFYWCAVLEVAFLGVKMVLGTSDVRETIKNLCFVLLAAGFFLAVINNYHTWTWNVINGLKTIAGEAATICAIPAACTSPALRRAAYSKLPRLPLLRQRHNRSSP
ncbi:type IV secretion system protein [Desulfovibrio sp. ZJ369]|uniref:type IV secretion system protein n=1 Tax=Desulfovibrio sp. ZJ369 TaxID=2709793 RepID=UPI001F14E8BB|nr:type IV secretion system protein [Desulfovibrio sp. ZJ369]